MLTPLPNTSCDLYCDNSFNQSILEHKFKCGSKINSRIRAVYDLADLCPDGFIYIKELQGYMTSYHGDKRNLCSSGTEIYKYDRKVAWQELLNIVERLKLTKSAIRMDFDDGIDIDPSWKCPSSTTTSTTYSSYFDDEDYSSDYITYYVLSNGCLHAESHKSWPYRSMNRLCIIYRTEMISLTDGTDSLWRYHSSISRLFDGCPENWFDLNLHCYRVSNTPKTIQEASNSCVTLSEYESIQKYQEVLEFVNNTQHSNDDGSLYQNKAEIMEKIKEYLYKMHFGEIAQYTSSFQDRLGFFLLDKCKVSDEQFIAYIF